MNMTMMMWAHLAKRLPWCRSYGARTETSGTVQVSFDAEAVAGRHCIMVDDLCDSGLTLLTVRAGSGCSSSSSGSTAHMSMGSMQKVGRYGFSCGWCVAAW
jgi:hypoxanthine-guanine phosphoribosyltransferase